MRLTAFGVSPVAHPALGVPHPWACGLRYSSSLFLLPSLLVSEVEGFTDSRFFWVLLDIVGELVVSGILPREKWDSWGRPAVLVV